MNDTPPCPICGKPAEEARLRPFCSRRCADVDLGRWFAGTYRVPGDEPFTVESEEEAESHGIP